MPMIEQIMFFVLGLLTAGLMLIALLPALWRRAVRLTRQALEATLPLSPGEIAAEKDQIRAAHAVEIRRIETERERTEAALQAERSTAGARLILIQQHEATIVETKNTISAREATIAARDATIPALEATIATLEQERDNLVTNLTGARMSNQALDDQAMALRQSAEQRLARIGELDAVIATLNARLGEAQASAARLQEETRQRGDDLLQQAHRLREADSQIATLGRRLAAAEGVVDTQAATISGLQEERLALITEAGQRTRERDHERIERQALVAENERLSRLVGELSQQRDKARASLAAQKADHSTKLAEAREARRTAERDLKRLKREAAGTADSDAAEATAPLPMDIPGPQTVPLSAHQQDKPSP